jgi:hypothetical protein
MKSPVRSASVAAVAALSVASYAACGKSSGGSSSPSKDGGADSSLHPDGGGKDGSGDATLVDSGRGFGTDTGGCSSSCEGGVCLQGACCEAENVCGSACCGTGTVCLFDQCVMPGNPCHSSQDCAMGQYCETALGPGDAGADAGGTRGPEGGAEGGGPVLEAGCSEPLPTAGRCLPLPPTCAGDAGTTADGGPCFAPCTYVPDAGGPLNAVKKWQWGPTAVTDPTKTDVWSTPTVGRIYDTNCDGVIDDLDSPVIVFISGAVDQTCCGCGGEAVSTCETGVVRMVDGSKGTEIWTLDKAQSSSIGFMGSSPALGDVDNDGYVDIVVMTGEGYIVVLDRYGNVESTSDKPYPHATAPSAGQGTGWGGGIVVGDMNADGFPEIAFGDTVWTTKGGGVTLLFTGGKGTGGGQSEETSAMTDIDNAPDNNLELLAGNTVYTYAGTVLWEQTGLPDGFPAVGDFDKNGTPEVVLVGCPAGGASPCQGEVWILEGATGNIVAGPVTLPFTQGTANHGGPPTVADFDGDGFPEIGIAGATYYAVLKPVITNGAIAGPIDVLWKMGDHDFSSSVTGSTVFDFEGDGVPEVVYADECWLWVFDGPTGAVRLAISHSSFTGTETSMLADIDGDGHAELLIPSNGVDMHKWNCLGYAGADAGGGMTINGQSWTPGPNPNQSYAGLVAYGDSANSWVGTRTLWNEHTYHVTNICDDTDQVCPAPNVYGSIPQGETPNWTVSYLNDFRQNVQHDGIFNAPDAIVALAVDCTTPVVAHVSVRNIGQAGLPPGVSAGVFTTQGNTQVGLVTTTLELLPGQTQTLNVTLSPGAAPSQSYYAQILMNAAMPTFHECRTDNDTSTTVTAVCSQ